MAKPAADTRRLYDPRVGGTGCRACERLVTAQQTLTDELGDDTARLGPGGAERGGQATTRAESNEIVVLALSGLLSLDERSGVVQAERSRALAWLETLGRCS